MADLAPDGPPQEGLDPKLKFLTDLAPATTAPAGDDATERSATVSAARSAAAVDAALGPHREGPPQYGQDPKLLACVNDGQLLPGVGDAVASSAATGVSNGVHAAPPREAMPDLNGGQAAVAEKNDRGAASGGNLSLPFPSPTKSVAAAMLSIHQNSPPPPPALATEISATQREEQDAGGQRQPPSHQPQPESKAPLAPGGKNAHGKATNVAQPQQAANVNPNLTSSESLAEWNRIHATAGPSYNFFKKSQTQGNKKIAWRNDAASSYARTEAVGAPPKDELVESSKARAASSAGAAVAAAVMKPLFTLGSDGDAAANVVHAPTSQDPLPSATDLAHAAGLPPPHDPEGPTNSNFWVQEEEERFLLGLRMYGWGQWKRIQTVVRTRTNKQIKSHAQKREKVNPQIKHTYSKGKSRRGRISSKVLAEDARAVALAGGNEAVLRGSDDGTVPSLDQAWRDVYGTNNGDGPNSRHRRYRHAGSAQRRARPPTEAGKGRQPPQQHPQQQPPPAPTTVFHTPQPRQPPRSSQPTGMTSEQAIKLATGGPTAPPPNSHSAPAASHPPQNAAPPPSATAPRQPVSRYSSAAVPVPGAVAPPRPLPAMPAAINHAAAAAATNPIANDNGNTHRPSATSKRTDTTSLRPGMRVYSRVAAPDGTGDRWLPGTIYSAKIDPAKLARSSGNQNDLPLVFHIQHDDGGEDPVVPEEDVMSRGFYEGALRELERHHAIVRPEGYASPYPHPLEGGTPVYCQWIEALAPGRHGRWLPGTIHSCRPAGAGSDEHLYHVLFDTEGERRDIPQGCVVDRTEYHELAKLKQNAPQHGAEGTTRPIGELYDLFLRKQGNDHGQPPQHAANEDADGGGGQLDLLSTASQIAATARKRESAGGGGARKRRAMAEQQRVHQV